jgi:beta-lactamase regulating signal transducer with metallopeptidase domain
VAEWLRACLLLAGGAAVVTGLAAAAARWARTGVGRRAAWRAATVGLALLLLAETTGLAGGLCACVGQTLTPAPTPAPGDESISAAVPPSLAVPDDLRVEAPAIAPPAQPGPGSAPAEAEAVAWWPGGLWLAGAAVVAGRACLARLLLLAYRRRQRPAADGGLWQRVRSVAARLGLRRAVLVLEAEGLAGPAAFGIVWPTVAVPAGFADHFTAAEQEAMLAHELGHLAGRDPAWHLLADLVTAALWWHPLAWWARGRLRSASELAADEASLVVPGGPGLLAECLVELGGRLAAARPGAWAGMAGNGFRSALGRRVQRLLDLDARAWRRPGRVLAGLAVVVGPAALVAAALVVTAWARARVPDEGDVPMQTVQRAWKRSLAALVLTAALGTSPGSGAPPEAPPDKDRDAPRPAALGGDAEPGKAAPDLKALEKQRNELAGQLRQVEARSAALKEEQDKLKDQALARDPDKALVAQTSLLRWAEELARDLAEVEAKIKAMKEDKKPDAVGSHVKVFRLQHADPEEVRDLLERMLPRGGDPGHLRYGPGMPGPGNQPPPSSTGYPSNPAAIPGGSMPPGGMVLGPNNGLMGGAGGPPTWRVAVDARTHSVIVRGGEEDLQSAADLVELLDQADGKTVAKGKNFRAFRLKFAEPAEVIKILQKLEINVGVTQLPKTKTLLASGKETDLKEAEEVISALDVEAKPPKDK